MRKTGAGKEYSYVGGVVETKRLPTNDNVYLSKSFNPKAVGVREVVPKGVSGSKESIPYSKIFGGFDKGGSDVGSGASKLKVVNKSYSLPNKADTNKLVNVNKDFVGTDNTVLNRVPEYELSPNAPSQATGFGTQRGISRGGFRTRSSGQRVLNFKPDIENTGNRELVVVPEYTPTIQSTPSPDIALSRSSAIKNIGETLGNKDFLSAGITGDAVYSTNKESTLTKPFVAVASKTETKPLTIVTPTILNKQDNQQINKLNTNISLNNKIDTAQKTNNALKFDSAQIQNTQQQTRQETFQVTKTSFANVPTIVRTPSNTINNFEPVKINNPVTPQQALRTYNPPKPVREGLYEEAISKTNYFNFKTPSKEKKKGRYRVEVGRIDNKYYFDLGVGGEEIVRRGASIARNTAAATVKITPINGSVKPRSIGEDFSVNKEGLYIEKTIRRINTGGEKTQISRAPKKLTKGNNYNKALYLSGKGYSLKQIRKML